jgi:uncharacterized membrane protein YbhN (UPF0104 family)
VVERVLDMLSVVLCFVVLAVCYPAVIGDVFGVLHLIDDPQAFEHRTARAIAGAVAIGIAVVLGVLYAMVRRRAWADRLVERVTEPLWPRAARIIRMIASGMLDGARGLGDVRTLALVLLLSVVLWALIVQTYLLSLLALRIEVPLLSSSLALVVTVAAAVFLPQGPGYVGSWQLACVFVLEQICGVPRDAAVAYSFVTWVIQLAVNLGSGAIAAAFQDLSVRELVQESERDAAPASAETP